MFSGKFWEIRRNTIFIEHLWATTSERLQAGTSQEIGQLLPNFSAPNVILYVIEEGEDRFHLYLCLCFSVFVTIALKAESQSL